MISQIDSRPTTVHFSGVHDGSLDIPCKVTVTDEESPPQSGIHKLKEACEITASIGGPGIDSMLTNQKLATRFQQIIDSRCRLVQILHAAQDAHTDDGVKDALLGRLTLQQTCFCKTGNQSLLLRTCDDDVVSVT